MPINSGGNVDLFHDTYFNGSDLLVSCSLGCQDILVQRCV